MDIYHFTNLKDIWHVNCSKANRWLPRIQCNPSDVLYICLINLVSRFYRILSKHQGVNKPRKSMISLVHWVRKEPQKGWCLPNPQFIITFPCFNTSVSTQGKEGICHFRTIGLVVLDYFPLSLSKDSDSCFVGSRSSYPSSQRNHFLKRLITEQNRSGFEACTALLRVVSS